MCQQPTQPKIFSDMAGVSCGICCIYIMLSIHPTHILHIIYNYYVPLFVCVFCGIGVVMVEMRNAWHKRTSEYKSSSAARSRDPHTRDVHTTLTHSTTTAPTPLPMGGLVRFVCASEILRLPVCVCARVHVCGTVVRM